MDSHLLCHYLADLRRHSSFVARRRTHFLFNCQIAEILQPSFPLSASSTGEQKCPVKFSSAWWMPARRGIGWWSGIDPVGDSLEVRPIQRDERRKVERHETKIYVCYRAALPRGDDKFALGRRRLPMISTSRNHNQAEDPRYPAHSVVAGHPRCSDDASVWLRYLPGSGNVSRR